LNISEQNPVEMIVNAKKKNGMNHEIRISNLEKSFKNYEELLKNGKFFLLLDQNRALTKTKNLPP